MAEHEAIITTLLDPFRCANTDQKIDGEASPCHNKAKLICGNCKLVQYCCKECQTADWKTHKAICKSRYTKEPYVPEWFAEKRLPSFLAGGPPKVMYGSNQYLWGNVPALDVLNVQGNEGEEAIVQQDLALLFAASGDLRNIVKTLVGLPENYAGRCSVLANDYNISVTARNAMLLLTALHFEPEVATPIMLHLWYSAFLPQAILQALQSDILPYIQDVCDKINDRAEDATCAKTFEIGRASLRLVLKKKEWTQLLTMFRVRKGLSISKAQAIRSAITMGRIDQIDRSLCTKPPGRRAGAINFREHGVLLPFGASFKDFTEPNPTFFNKPGVWPMLDDADPLNGWSYKEYIKCISTATNDVYGAFFSYIRNMLLAFCKRVRSYKMAFQLLAIDARTLPNYVRDMRFDRIEVSNICDRGYTNPRVTLSTFSPLLKTKSENPKATLILLFLNAVREEESHVAESTKHQPPLQSTVRKMKKYLDIEEHIIDAALGLRKLDVTQFVTSPDYGTAIDALSLFGDFDAYFERFLRNSWEGTCMFELARRHNLKVKSKHTIISPWPYRVTEKTTKEEFKVMFSQNTNGHERYMEFEKA